MKTKIILLLIFTILITACYQLPDSSSGSVTIKLNSDIMKSPPAGFDGELKLAVFDAGELDSIVDQTPSDISYNDQLPTPILANNSVPFNGRDGVLSLLNVPSDRQLSLLIEHYGTLYEASSTYYHSYSGVSAPFEVSGGGSTEVTLTMVPTTDGTISVNFSGVFDFDMYLELLTSEDFASLVTFLPGNEIDYDSFSTQSASIFNNSYSTITYPITIDALPGRKMRLLVSQWSGPGGGDQIGVSDIFELQPGLTLSVPVSYYVYFGSGVY